MNNVQSQMSNILYFSDMDPAIKNGEGLQLKMHYQMLRNLYGNHVFAIIISGKRINEAGDNTLYLPESSQKNKVASVIHGYSPYLSLYDVNVIINMIIEENIDIVFVENSTHGNLIRKLKNRFPKLKVITYFPDIEANLMRKEMQSAKLYHKIVLLDMIKNEKMTVRYADRKFVLNSRDATLFRQYYHCEPDAVIPIIAPDIANINYLPRHVADQPLTLLFVGGDFWPNVVGMRWFINGVMPLIKCDVSVIVVGLRMEKYRNEFESMSPNVKVVGTVDDLRKYFEKADAFIAPITDGGGMKVKTAVALSYGKTFLGSTESLVGYWDTVPDTLRNNGIYLCKDERDFAEIINDLYHVDFEINRLDIQSWEHGLCSYEANFAIFKKLFEFT